MNKTITYSSFVIAGLIMVIAFVTATTYTQLAVAVILYPLFIYFAFKVFPRKTIQPESVKPSQKESEGIADIDKRTFLKLIGATGLSFFLYSIFIKKAGTPFSLFGSKSESGTVSLEDSAGDKIDPVEKQPTDGYRLTELDDSIIAYFGYTHKDGSWFIMRVDTETGSYRYVRGDSDFTIGWADREHSKYDYYANVF
ncbi:MAG: hypothetical protein G01um101416_706 [Microgenomates group bacterium Gr01-1014_16]|nr:MAG: hypothetical protein G01um101416_706 [Microgenomates group bacterium Gr01-1014_16]